MVGLLNMAPMADLVSQWLALRGWEKLLIMLVALLAVAVVLVVVARMLRRLMPAQRTTLREDEDGTLIHQRNATSEEVVSVDETPEVVCPGCGRRGESGAVFCDACGSRYHAGEVRQQLRWAGKELVLFIGRGDDCSVMLHHPKSSRHHAQLTFRHGCLYLRDLKSSNGTFLFGSPVLQDTLVCPGDEIRFGHERISYDHLTSRLADAIQRSDSIDRQA